MKKSLLTAVVAAVLFIIAGCEQFSTTYERIDDSELRLLNIMYEPADAAPGDSVTVIAVFAGRLDDDIDDILDWWISFNVIRDRITAVITAIDSVRLGSVARRVDGYTFSPNTHTVAHRFRIPEDIVKTSRHIPDDWKSIVPFDITPYMSDEVAAMTKEQLADTINTVTEDMAAEILGDLMGGGDTLTAHQISVVFQLITVPFTITVKQRGSPNTIESQHVTRYNSRFIGLRLKEDQSVPVNTNPIIDDVVVYKVRGSNISSVNNKDGLDYETIPLDNTGNSEIVIEDGYSYFLDARSSNIDSSITISNRRVEELHHITRLFQHDSRETAGIHHTKFMFIDNSTGRITPPTDQNITKFTFWVRVTDESANEFMRPRGSALAEVSGRFVYGR